MSRNDAARTPATVAASTPGRGTERTTFVARLRSRWLERRLQEGREVCGYILCDDALPESPVERRFCSETCADARRLWKSEMLTLHPFPMA